MTAALALLALLLGPIRLDPSALGLDDHPAVQAVRHGGVPLAIGAAIGSAFAVLGAWLANRRPRKSPLRGLPDFTALIPVTRAERWLWLPVAIGAGVAEELVFRGWLYGGLETYLGLWGVTILVVATILFGLAHAYQGPLGVLATGALGLALGLLYLATGSLVAPMVVHALIDLRVLLLPVPRVAAPAAPNAPVKA